MARTTSRRLRLDAELVRRGLARSREQAAALIADGRVTVGGSVATKPATAVETAAAVVVNRPRYHEVMTLIAAVLLVGYVALLFARLR